MKGHALKTLLPLFFFLGSAFILLSRVSPGFAAVEPPAAVLSGTILDDQGQPVEGAAVALANSDDNPDSRTGLFEDASAVITQKNGSFLIPVDHTVTTEEEILVERAHFETLHLSLSPTQAAELNAGHTVYLGEIILARRITTAFWFATLIFVAVLALIASGWLHNTLSALLGAALIFAFSYLGPLVKADFFIFGFERALTYIDWNVIFLIMGMMIVIAVVERTGIFQWLAFASYKLSGGRTWLLLPILMLITGIASAFLDNVTTMLLMTPITVQIALSLGISPLALLMPEVFASNVVGISTLVGTPTNILIGSFAGISFADFLANLTPGVLLALVGLIAYSLWLYRKDLRTDIDEEMQAVLLDRLEKQSVISEPDHLKKAGWVGLGMGILFITGEHFHLLPSVTAIMGATALLIWIRPDIDEMIESVDWTTLVFFMSLFIAVGAIQEVGLIAFIADWIGQLVGENLVLAMLAVIWFGALLSTVIANIPFTAAMLPVIGFLSGNIPGAANKALFYCLSVGSALGGNGSLIGASANLVTAGIAERAGYPITYSYFLRKGFPALVITVGLASIWLLVRFL